MCYNPATSHDTPAFPGGEVLAVLQRRSAQAYWNKSIVIITHGGLIEMVFHYVLGIPIERKLASFVDCDHTSLFHWRWLEVKDLSLGG